MTRIWKNKRTGRIYREGSRSVKTKRYYLRNKRTGEKVGYGAYSNVSYKRKGLFGKQTVRGESYTRGNRYHPRLWNSPNYDWRTGHGRGKD